MFTFVKGDFIMKRKIDSMETIALMSDEELENNLRGARNVAVRAHNQHTTDYDAEVDFCFYFREAEIRHTRKEAYREWVATHRYVHYIPGAM